MVGETLSLTCLCILLGLDLTDPSQHASSSGQDAKQIWLLCSKCIYIPEIGSMLTNVQVKKKIMSGYCFPGTQSLYIQLEHFDA